MPYTSVIRALEQAAVRVLPDASPMTLQPGAAPFRGELVSVWCLREAARQRLDARTLALQLAMNVHSPFITDIRAENGFLNLRLSNFWYREQVQSLCMHTFSPVRLSFSPASPFIRTLTRDPDWEQRRDRANPVWAVSYAARRAQLLARRTTREQLFQYSDPCRSHVHALCRCIPAASSAEGLFSALYAAALTFRGVLNARKPGFDAPTLALATACILRQGLDILGLSPTDPGGTP